MSDFEEGMVATEAVETEGADSGAESSGSQDAVESGGGGAGQSSGAPAQQSASAAPAPAGLTREQFEQAMRQRDSYWQSQRKADRDELERLRRMYARPAPQQRPAAPVQGPLPSLQEWIQKGYTPESWEMLNGMNQYHENRYKEFQKRHDSLYSEIQTHQRKAQQQEIEKSLDQGWGDAMSDVYAKEFKHLSGNAELDGLLKKLLFVEAFQAIQSKRDPRYLDNRAVLRGVLSVVDKLVKAGIAKHVKVAPAPAAPAVKGAPTKPGERKSKAKSEKEFFENIRARARAALE